MSEAGHLPTTWPGANDVGLEKEVGTIDAASGENVPTGAEILAPALNGSAVAANIHDELFANSIEMVTEPWPTVRQAVAQLQAVANVVMEVADRWGLALNPAATHPTAIAADQVIREGSVRRDERVAFHGHALTQQVIWSLHIHVGVHSAEGAVAGLRALLEELPVFIALAASSPYWEGRDTGMVSYRPTKAAAAPFSAMPPAAESWKAYQRAHQTLVSGGFGFVRGAKDIHWDIRISRHGTIELRICDGVATDAEAASLAALAQCIVARAESVQRGGLRRRGPRRPPLFPLIIEGNRFWAMAKGFHAGFVEQDGRETSLLAHLDELVSQLTPWAVGLGCADEIGGVADIVAHGNGAHRQRLAVAQTQDLRSAALVGAWEMRENCVRRANQPPLWPTSASPQSGPIRAVGGLA